MAMADIGNGNGGRVVKLILFVVTRPSNLEVAGELTNQRWPQVKIFVFLACSVC
jgi:hypothetical protein